MKFAKKPYFKAAIFVLAVVVAVIIGTITPPEGYTVALTRFIGIFVWMIICMAFNVLPEWVCFLLASMAWAYFGVDSFTGVFSQFGGNTVWTIFCLTGFLGSLATTGVFKRIALKVYSFFKPTYNGQVLAVLLSGTAVTPLAPSMMVKFGILQPLGQAISNSAGYEGESKPATGLFLAAFVPNCVGGLAFLTGSSSAIALLAYLGDGASEFTWIRWASACLLWLTVVLVGMYFFIVKYYKPKESKEVSPTFAKDLYAALGPMSKDEKFALVVLVVAMVMWVTESLHGIKVVYVGALGLALMCAKGYFTSKDFTTKIQWSVVVMTGFIQGIITLCSKSGFADWVGEVVGPLLGGVTGKPYLLVLIIVLVTYILRTFIISQKTVVVICFAAFAPLVMAAGMSPWFVVFSAQVASTAWNVKFTSVNYIQGSAFAPGMTTFAGTLPGSVAFMVFNLAGLLLSVPVWQLMGLI